MRLDYNTFTGRRSVFVLVAAMLILLTWGAIPVCGPTLMKQMAGMSMGKNAITAVILLLQNGLVVVSLLIAALVTERDRSLKQKFGLEMAPGYSLQHLFPVFVLAALITYGSQYGLTHLLKAVGHEPKPQAMVDMFRSMTPLTFVLFALIPVIAAPIAEELAFRHIFYRLVRIVLYRKEAAVLVSLVFALFHVSLGTLIQTKPFPWEMLVIPVVPLFLLAMILQWQYEKSKSVIPSMLIHAGFNLTTVLLLALEVAYGKPQEAPSADENPAPAVPAVEAPADVSDPTPKVEAPAADEKPMPAAVPVEAVLQWDYIG